MRKPQGKLVPATGLEPVAPIIQNHGNPANKGDLQGLLSPAGVSQNEFGPQSSPQTPSAARLSRRDLRDLIAMCSREVGYCGLDQHAGRRAAELKQKLQAMHAHGEGL